MSSNATEFCRQVMAHLVCIQSEDDSVLRELSDDGFIGRFQREQIDNAIAEHWNEGMKDFCTSMQIASISASQAAQVISAFVILQERKSDHG